jgi:Flp pilus assembly protein TadD
MKPRLMPLFWLGVWIPPILAQEAPVAVILSSLGGTYARARDRASLPLHPGEFLFDGDSLQTLDSPATVLHCPSRAVIDVPRGGQATVNRKQVKVTPRPAGPARSVPVCEMPELERMPRAEEAHLGSSLFDASARPSDPGPVSSRAGESEVAAVLTRFAAAQREQRDADAFALGRTLERYWPESTGLKPRLFQHGQAVAANRQPPAPASAQGAYAVVVGISKYRDKDPKHQLRFAHADALSFYEFLRSPRGGSLPDDHIALLVDEGATTQAIRGALSEVLKKRVDTVILFIASHGLSTDAGAGFLISYDTNWENPGQTAISMSEINRLLTVNLAGANTVFAFVDACRSGSVAALHSQIKGLSLPKGTLFGFTASEAFESSYESPDLGGGHGVFSYYLVEGLNGSANQGATSTVIIDDVVEYVHQSVRRFTSRRQNPNTFGRFSRATPLADLRLPGPGRVAAPSVVAGGLGRRGTDGDLRLELENRGQTVILGYLEGEESAVTRENFVSAQADFAAARKLAPESIWLEARETFSAGRVALFDKDYGRAAELFERAARLDPAGAAAYNGLGIVRLELADYPGALAFFEDAIRRAPRWAYAWHNKALAQMQTGDYAGAIRSYQTAMENAPLYSYLPYNLGVLYQTLNRSRDAESQYRKAMELAPNRGEPLNALGTLRAAQGKRAEAEGLFRRALDLDPTLEVARQNLAALAAESQRRR